MSSELAPFIERLLYSNETVVLPGLGAFVSSSAPANVDYAGGTIAPPAKVLTFNDNLTTDDGLLTYELVQEKHISDQEARAWVEERIAQIQAQLNQREIVALPGIGRLYKNYVQKIQFLPDATNFSRDHFGLPPLQFSPLSRSREVTDQPATAPTTTPANTTPTAPTVAKPQPQPTNAYNTAAPPPVFDNPPPAKQQGLRIVLIASLLILSGAIAFYFLKMQRDRLLANQTPTETAPTTDTAPIRHEEQSVMPAPTTEKEPTQPKVEAEKPQPAAPAQPSPAAKSRECILVIGLFKDPNNIARLKNTLQKNGFQVYSAAGANGAESIGIQFNYTDESEVKRNTAKLQEITGEKNIRVKKK